MTTESAPAPQTRDIVAGASCIVFDFDGTLAPNLDLAEMRRQVVALARAQGVPDAVFEHLYIVEIIDTAARWLADRTPAAATALLSQGHATISEFEIAAAARTRPFPEIREVLQALRNADKRLGVVTRNCARAVRTVFNDIDDFCDAVLARDDVIHLKPDTRHLERALQALGGIAANALMVGDGALDMRAGRDLNMFCVGVLTGSGTAEQLTRAGAHLVLPRASDLLRFLKPAARTPQGKS